MTRRYITTAIDFPNAPPHMGHVMEKIIADVAARWFRLNGNDVRFQIGTDDHGIKIQRTAEKLGLKPSAMLSENIPKFRTLFDRLGISYDVFMSTSLTKGHFETVQELWKRLVASGHLEKRTYRGLYCAGCESFVTKKDLVDGKCPNHLVEPEEIREENWFFLLSKEQDFLRGLIDVHSGSYAIVPSYRGNEVRAFLESGLDDVSFSRPKSTLYWGVPVPDDTNQTMYVWCDNLTNYISTLGYLSAHEQREWWDDAEVTHVIGKDIARFHALNWPAMLHCAGVRTPDRLLVHGFITSEGQKMSKSIGNVVVPSDVLDRFGVDPLRFYLCHEVPMGRDGDFSWDRFSTLYSAVLRNAIGNLLNRVLVLLGKDGGVLSVPDSPLLLGNAWERYATCMTAFDFSNALNIPVILATELNKYIDVQKPWGLKDAARAQVLGTLAENLRHIALMLLPFLPSSAVAMSTQLGLPYSSSMGEKTFLLSDRTAWGSTTGWNRIGSPSILFPPIS